MALSDLNLELDQLEAFLFGSRTVKAGEKGSLASEMAKDRHQFTLEFNEVVKSHAVYPADVNPDLLEEAPELPDQKKWDNSSPMDRKYSSKKLKEHGIKDQIDN